MLFVIICYDIICSDGFLYMFMASPRSIARRSSSGSVSGRAQWIFRSESPGYSAKGGALGGGCSGWG